MKDRFGRQIDYLRISVIDHCNLRCVYCMPLRGLSFIPSPELLTAAEIERVAEAAVAVGFRKFRLTGGEPTLRPDLVEIVARIAALEGVEDVAMTTNAILLPRLAQPLDARADRGCARAARPHPQHEPGRRVAELPLRGRAGCGRLHLAGERALLRHLQSHAPHGGRPLPPLPAQ